MALCSDYYREGFLNKAGKGILQAHLHSWRPRYFVLNDLQLKYYKKKPSKEMLPDNMLGCIEVSEVESVSVMKNEKNAFQITTKSPKSTRTYYMSGKSDDEIQGWIKCLAKAKEKYQEKEGKKSSSGDYDEPSVAAPTKPPRSPNLSEGEDSPASPITPASPASQTSSPGAKPVRSQYSVLEYPTKNEEAAVMDQKTEPNKDDKLYQDPTYDSIDDNAATRKKKDKSSEQDANLYDTYDTVTKEAATKNNESTNENSDLYDAVAPLALAKKATSSKSSDPSRATPVPPPLPARLPSMSDESITIKNEKTPEGNAIGVYDEVGTNVPSPTKAPIGVYGEVGSPNIPDTMKAPIGVYDEVGSLNIPDTTKAPVGLYDEVGALSIPDTTKLENEIPDGLYNEIGALDILPMETKVENNEQKGEEFPVMDPTHVYAKPIKSPQSSLRKRNLSKRKLFPGLMDVGEVPIDVEEDAAGGQETLERGMTKPTGDRFAVEELREILTEYDAEMNNNGGDLLEDFDVNQDESAFEVLRRFFERCS